MYASNKKGYLFKDSPSSYARAYAKGYTFKASAVASGYDWTSSLFTDSNVELDAGTGDVYDQTAPNKRSVFHKPISNQPIFWVDFSGANNELKYAYTFHNYDSQDDFNEVDTGVRLGAEVQANLIVGPSTGVAISSNNLVDGDYSVKYQFKHDTAKTDTYYSITLVLNAASNVLTFYRKWVSHSSSYQAYESVADTKVVGNKVIQVTWDPDTNTWSIQTSAQEFFNAASDGNKTISASGGTLTDSTSSLGITTDAGDGRVWEVTIG